MPKRQLEIPGTEAPSIPEVEDAAEAYVKARDSRMRLTEKEVAAKINLTQVLLAHEAELAPGENGTKPTATTMRLSFSPRASGT